MEETLQTMFPLDPDTPGMDKYALQVNPDTNRIEGFTYDLYCADENDPRVTELPNGTNILDFLYINGEYVYDPYPINPEPEERITALEQQNEMLLECILEMSELLYE